LGESLQDLRILLIEDDALTLEVYSIFLSMEGAIIRAAASTGEAFQILDEWKPEIIISDIGLPGEDGYSFISRVRARSDLAGVYAIAITGYSNTGKAKEAGFQEVLSKPLDPAELMKRIQAYSVQQGEPGD
jgi:two-component system, chemotaxis family, CheB/CheR fusion protein